MRSSKRRTAYGVMAAPFLFLALGFSLGWLARPVYAFGGTRLTVAPAAEVRRLVELVAVTPVPTPVPVVTPTPSETPALTLVGTFTAYAYCPCVKCCGQWSGGPTASGTMPKEERAVAADWDVLPAGTEVYIEGLGWRTVEDTGSGIDGQALDVYYDSHQAALEQGVREVKVYAVPN